MRMTDEVGSPIGYLPLALEAGEESAVITFKVIPEELGERLRSSISPDVTVWGRIAGGGAYQDLGVEPLDLDAYLHGFALVEIKVAADSGITGVRRLGQFLGGSSGGAAGWLD